MSKKGAVYNKYRLKDYAIWVFGNGFHNGHYSAFDMKMLALYLRDECGMKPARLREYLIDFMQAESGRQNKSELAFRAQEALAFAAKKQNVLIQVDRVSVYESEVQWLKEQTSKHIVSTVRLFHCLFTQSQVAGYGAAAGCQS